MSNHKFSIENYIIPLSSSFFPPFDPITGSCSSEYYTTDEMPLWDGNIYAAANTLKIRPYSVNTYADYTNGVTSADLLAIAWEYNHYANHEFNDLYPLEDAPYRYISGDADYDHDIDASDANMVQDLLLGNRYDLERNSWEWVHKDEIEEADERFVEDPYSFVIDYNWPGSEGIILPALTTDEIDNDNDKFFTFRTTKVGDILANSGWLVPSANSWVCGSGTYFGSEEIESRSVSITNNRISKGSLITISLSLDKNPETYAYQIPVFFSNQDFEFTDIVFPTGYNPAWNYNKILECIMIIDFAKQIEPVNLPNGKVALIRLKALKEINHLDAILQLYSAHNGPEFVGRDFENLGIEPKLEIEEIIPGSLYIEDRQNDDSHLVYIESPMNQKIDFELIDNLGHVIIKRSYDVAKGQNIFLIEGNFIPGVFYYKVYSNSESVCTKTIFD